MKALRAVCIGLLLGTGVVPAHAADLAVWWIKGFYPGEDEAMRRIVGTFEENTGQTVELPFWASTDLATKVAAAICASMLASSSAVERWTARRRAWSVSNARRRST